MRYKINAESLSVLASTLRFSRESLGMSISELSRKSGLARSTIGRYERAQRTPELEGLLAIAAPLDCYVCVSIGDGEPIPAGDSAAIRFAVDAARTSAGMLTAIPDSTPTRQIGDLVRLCDAVDVPVWIVWGDR